MKYHKQSEEALDSDDDSDFISNANENNGNKKSNFENFFKEQYSTLSAKYTFLSSQQIKKKILVMWKKNPLQQENSKLQKIISEDKQKGLSKTKICNNHTKKPSKTASKGKVLVPLDIDVFPTKNIKGVLKSEGREKNEERHVSFNNDPEIRYRTASEASSNSTFKSNRKVTRNKSYRSYSGRSLEYRKDQYSPMSGTDKNFNDLLNGKCSWSYKTLTINVETKTLSHAKFQSPLVDTTEKNFENDDNSFVNNSACGDYYFENTGEIVANSQENVQNKYSGSSEKRSRYTDEIVADSQENVQSKVGASSEKRRRYTDEIVADSQENVQSKDGGSSEKRRWYTDEIVANSQENVQSKVGGSSEKRRRYTDEIVANSQENVQSKDGESSKKAKKDCNGIQGFSYKYTSANKNESLPRSNEIKEGFSSNDSNIKACLRQTERRSYAESDYSSSDDEVVLQTRIYNEEGRQLCNIPDDSSNQSGDHTTDTAKDDFNVVCNGDSDRESKCALYETITSSEKQKEISVYSTKHETQNSKLDALEKKHAPGSEGIFSKFEYGNNKSEAENLSLELSSLSEIEDGIAEDDFISPTIKIEDSKMTTTNLQKGIFKKCNDISSECHSICDDLEMPEISIISDIEHDFFNGTFDMNKYDAIKSFPTNQNVLKGRDDSKSTLMHQFKNTKNGRENSSNVSYKTRAQAIIDTDLEDEPNLDIEKPVGRKKITRKATVKRNRKKSIDDIVHITKTSLRQEINGKLSKSNKRTNRKVAMEKMERTSEDNEFLAMDRSREFDCEISHENDFYTSDNSPHRSFSHEKKNKDDSSKRNAMGLKQSNSGKQSPKRKITLKDVREAVNNSLKKIPLKDYCQTDNYNIFEDYSLENDESPKEQNNGNQSFIENVGEDTAAKSMRRMINSIKSSHSYADNDKMSHTRTLENDGISKEEEKPIQTNFRGVIKETAKKASQKIGTEAKRKSFVLSESSNKPENDPELKTSKGRKLSMFNNETTNKKNFDFKTNTDMSIAAKKEDVKKNPNKCKDLEKFLQKSSKYEENEHTCRTKKVAVHKNDSKNDNIQDKTDKHITRNKKETGVRNRPSANFTLPKNEQKSLSLKNKMEISSNNLLKRKTESPSANIIDKAMRSMERCTQPYLTSCQKNQSTWLNDTEMDDDFNKSPILTEYSYSIKEIQSTILFSDGNTLNSTKQVRNFVQTGKTKTSLCKMEQQSISKKNIKHVKNFKDTYSAKSPVKPILPAKLNSPEFTPQNSWKKTKCNADATNTKESVLDKILGRFPVNVKSSKTIRNDEMSKMEKTRSVKYKQVENNVISPLNSVEVIDLNYTDERSPAQNNDSFNYKSSCNFNERDKIEKTRSVKSKQVENNVMSSLSSVEVIDLNYTDERSPAQNDSSYNLRKRKYKSSIEDFNEGRSKSKSLKVTTRYSDSKNGVKMKQSSLHLNKETSLEDDDTDSHSGSDYRPQQNNVEVKTKQNKSSLHLNKETPLEDDDTDSYSGSDYRPQQNNVEVKMKQNKRLKAMNGEGSRMTSTLGKPKKEYCSRIDEFRGLNNRDSSSVDQDDDYVPLNGFKQNAVEEKSALVLNGGNSFGTKNVQVPTYNKNITRNVPLENKKSVSRPNNANQDRKMSSAKKNSKEEADNYKKYLETLFKNDNQSQNTSPIISEGISTRKRPITDNEEKSELFSLSSDSDDLDQETEKSGQGFGLFDVITEED